MDISIIICTYNPEQRVFERCLKAVANLDCGSLQVEVLVIDNNSTQPVTSHAYVQQFLAKVPHARVVNEKRQGLAFARVCGFNEASAPVVIMFDDDNEPYPDYLANAQRIMAENGSVGIVGPGKVVVDYLDDTSSYVKSNLGIYFQEKSAENAEFTNEITLWASCYPPGTGQVIRREVTEAYKRIFLNGRLSAVDRKGNSLSSAGDSQLIWTALNLGYQVGHHPELKVNHLISAKRSNEAYIKRLAFHLNLSIFDAYVEMYPDRAVYFEKYKWYHFPSSLVKTIASSFVKRDLKGVGVKLASLLGNYGAIFKIRKVKPPFYFNYLLAALKLNGG